MNDAELKQLKYTELQKIAKSVGIKANVKADKLIQALQAYYSPGDDQEQLKESVAKTSCADGRKRRHSDVSEDESYENRIQSIKTKRTKLSRRTVHARIGSDTLEDVVSVPEKTGSTVEQTSTEEESEVDTVKAVMLEVDTIKAVVPEVDTVKAVVLEVDTVKAVVPEVDTVKAVAPEVDTVKAVVPEVDTVKSVAPEVDTVKAVVPEVDTVKAVAPEVDTVKAVVPEVDRVKAVVSEVDTVKAAVPEVDTIEAVAPVPDKDKSTGEQINTLKSKSKGRNKGTKARGKKNAEKENDTVLDEPVEVIQVVNTGQIGYVTERPRRRTFDKEPEEQLHPVHVKPESSANESATPRKRNRTYTKEEEAGGPSGIPAVSGDVDVSPALKAASDDEFKDGLIKALDKSAKEEVPPREGGRTRAPSVVSQIPISNIGNTIKASSAFIPGSISARFAKAHQKEFEKMQSIDQYWEKKQTRMQAIGCKPELQAITQQLRATLDKKYETPPHLKGKLKSMLKLRQPKDSPVDSGSAFKPSVTSVAQATFDFSATTKENSSTQPQQATASKRSTSKVKAPPSSSVESSSKVPAAPQSGAKEQVHSTSGKVSVRVGRNVPPFPASGSAKVTPTSTVRTAKVPNLPTSAATSDQTQAQPKSVPIGTKIPALTKHECRGKLDQVIQQSLTTQVPLRRSPRFMQDSAETNHTPRARTSTTPSRLGGTSSLNMTTLAQSRPKFDLQASLKRPVTWNMYKGKLKPVPSATVNPFRMNVKERQVDARAHMRNDTLTNQSFRRQDVVAKRRDIQ